MQKGLLHVLLPLSGSESSGLSWIGINLALTKWCLRFLHLLNPLMRGACIIGVELDLSNKSILRLTILLTSLKVG